MSHHGYQPRLIPQEVGTLSSLACEEISKVYHWAWGQGSDRVAPWPGALEKAPLGGLLFYEAQRQYLYLTLPVFCISLALGLRLVKLRPDK